MLYVHRGNLYYQDYIGHVETKCDLEEMEKLEAKT